ncbi:MAG TPA: PAS domain-containing sensor histidine kinase [Limnobacter sp.]|uniref:sensor histidine kinase n=1 Tax=Limnobacter sp. TaxID=2003368 RepID=UPI002EDBAF9E
MFKHLSNLSHHAAWRRQLELLLDSTGEGIYGIDLKGRCVFINKAGASLLGYTPDEVLGRNMHYLMHHSYANRDLMPVCDCQIFKAFQQNEGCRVDSEVLWRRDGTSFPAEYASYPIFEGTDVVGAVVTFNDISARMEAQNLRAAVQVELERRVLERTAELQQAHDRLRRLSAHMNTTRERERARIAREMHDDLGAKLTAFDLELKALAYRVSEVPELALRIGAMMKLSEGAMDSLRRILSDLRPGLLDHLGLWSAIEHLLGEFMTRSGIQTILDVQPDLEMVRLGRDAEIAVYRIVQEALTNVHKHAQARRVEVSVQREDRALVIRVQDDGRGLPRQSAAQGFGLMGIEERAWDLGAKCFIGNVPDGGTCIAITLPNVMAMQSSTSGDTA